MSYRFFKGKKSYIFIKVLEDLIYAELVKDLNSHSLLLDKQYGFHFSMPTPNVLTAINEFVYYALDKNAKARAVTLDISKSVQQVLAQHRPPPQALGLSCQGMNIWPNPIIFKSYHRVS